MAPGRRPPLRTALVGVSLLAAAVLLVTALAVTAARERARARYTETCARLGIEPWGIGSEQRRSWLGLAEHWSAGGTSAGYVMPDGRVWSVAYGLVLERHGFAFELRGQVWTRRMGSSSSSRPATVRDYDEVLEDLRARYAAAGVDELEVRGWR